MTHLAQTRAALYLRVSTDRQETDTQETACTAYALRHNLPISQLFRDTKSGSVPWRQRELATMITSETLFSDLIIYEYSRIGRDLVDTLDFLKTCTERALTVHVVKTGQIVRSDLSGKILSTVMALAAEIERDLLRSRTRDAIADRRARIKRDGSFISQTGKICYKLGRPFGTAGSSKIANHAEQILTLHAAQTSAAAIGRLLHVDPRTVKHFLTTHNAKP